MPILSPDLSSRLWGATRPRGLDSFALTYGAAFAVIGEGQFSTSEDSVPKHEERHFSIRVEKRTSDADWDVEFAIRGLKGGNAVASLSAVARRDTEFVVAGSDGITMNVRPLLLVPEPTSLVGFPRWA
jgi:hypothetical protein